VESEAKLAHYLNSATTTLGICVFLITYIVLEDALIKKHKVRVILARSKQTPRCDIERGLSLKINQGPKLTCIH
jgi:hypothetical protein